MYGFFDKKIQRGDGIMSYCLLIQDKIIYEGDTIEVYVDGKKTDTTIMKVLKVDSESQSFVVKLGKYNSEIDIPIDMWPGFSIIEKEKITDPNILFKLKGAI